MSEIKKTHFDQEQFDNAYPNGIENHYWTRARNQLIHDCLEKTVSTEGPMLEIGCGRGIVVEHLRNFGIDCWGCDLSKIVPISDAISPYLFSATDALKIPDKSARKFETLLLFDVLEHIETPAAFLKKILHLYSNAKQVCLTLPARQELWSNFDEYYGHQKRYTLDDASSLVERAGLTLRWHRYWFHSLYLPTRLLTKLGGQRNLVHSGPKNSLVATLHRAVSAYLYQESRLLPGSLPGTSVVIVGERS